MLRARPNIFDLQPLEARRFLTTATVDSTNTLQILGTTSAEDITINRNSSLRLTVSGVTATFVIGSAAGQVNKISIQASGGDDTILLTNNVRFPSNNAGIPATIAGNAGNDTITSGPGNDVLSGNDGNDLMDGGVGDDVMTGGAGLDTSNYSNRPTALKITINNSTDADGEIGIPENDKVETEEVIGGAGNDTIIGTSLADYIAGGAGNDSLDGMGGNDELTGGSGSDTLLGKEGDDYLQAQNQDRDTVNGGTGPNAVDNDLASIDTLDVSGLAASLSASLIEGPSPIASLSVSSPSDLDATYGNLGLAVGNALGWIPVAAAVDSQGRVVFVGTDYIDQGQGTPGDDFSVARFKADGTGLDPTFGTGGVRLIDFSDLGTYSTGHNEEDIAYGVAIGPGDSIFIVGQATDGVGSGEDSDFAIAKLTSSGAPDGSFGNAGRAISFLAGSNEVARDVVVQSDGKVVVVGGSSSGGGVAAVARFTAAGILDGTFGGGDGYATVDLGGISDTAVAVALQSLTTDSGAQRIVIGGTASGSFALARFRSDGTLDTTGFGVGGADGINGVAWQDLSGGVGQSTLRDLAVDSSNNIIAAGAAGAKAVLGKFSAADGAFVGSFGQSALSGSATFGSVTVDPQGRYVAVGASGGDFLVARATSSLQPDGTFATGGTVTTNFGVGYTDGAFAVSVLANNNIVAAGSSFTPSALTLPVAARYIGGGGIVPPNSESDVTEVEKFVKNEDFQHPTPELQAILDSVSDIGKLYITAQPNSLGNGTMVLNDRDNIVRIYKVTAQSGEENVAVEVDRVVFYYETDSTHFLSISTGGGNDIVTVDANITFPISIDGGTGNDVISLGSGDDVAFGGAGNDVLIGMAGHDQLDGGTGEDIVIGGISIANGDLTALKNIQTEWSLSTNQSSRVSHLTNPGNGGKNDPNKLIAGSTILDDAATDYLTGGDGNDWLFVKSTGANADVVTGPAERIDFV